MHFLPSFSLFILNILLILHLFFLYSIFVSSLSTPCSFFLLLLSLPFFYALSLLLSLPTISPPFPPPPDTSPYLSNLLLRLLLSLVLLLDHISRRGAKKSRTLVSRDVGKARRIFGRIFLLVGGGGGGGGS